MKSYICIILSSLIFLSSCNGQEKNTICNNQEEAIKIISELEEVKKQQVYIDSLSQHKRGVSYMVDNEKIRGKNYYQIKTGYNSQFHWETYHIFYVNKNNCNDIFIDDILSGNKITLLEWRKKNQSKNYVMKTKEELFSELFNEGSNINFTPKDLLKSDLEIKQFKNKLENFENQNPDSYDFNIDDLSVLVNNEIFTNNEKYINSSWLTYFIKKYKIDSDKIYFLMKLAISQEDYNAVKIINENETYIVSFKEIEFAQKRKKYVESSHGKIDIDEYYDPTKSKIKEIEKILIKKYISNKIQDLDGYTNLRKEKNSNSEIIQKIKSGEKIDVLDNTGNWFLIKTKEDHQGYVYKSKIVSE